MYRAIYEQVYIQQNNKLQGMVQNKKRAVITQSNYERLTAKVNDSWVRHCWLDYNLRVLVLGSHIYLREYTVK